MIISDHEQAILEMLYYSQIKFYNLETKENESITSLCHGNYLVIDFWHTKCTKCPLALEKLNDITKKNFNTNETMELSNFYNNLF